MSAEGEKTCPLCAEEMDLTDQQLKPCKCGYEICVWCWHHIMDMAEKDDTEGKCPACRTPYNKEKIVGMEAKCERTMNVERKVKSQKTKSKTCEGRKQLGSVRVIQRNLVYIVGLPLNLADEDILQHKEYFGQYGKVLKVSISRTAAGAIQHFANDTCSVYITYSKEVEAIRCIQSVHGFVLEDRSLRACFGTTKYCHAWLRSVPCSNPDCLYLHEIGSQEDSFSKDEIVSAYTRSRVQQITGSGIDMQRGSGNMLPPPADEYCNNRSASPGKPVSISSTNNPASNVRDSPPNSSSGRSGSLPAAASWGMRASNNHTPGTLACLNGPIKQKPDTCSGPMAISMAVESPTQVSMLQCDIGKKINKENRMTQKKGKVEQLEPIKQYMGTDCQETMSGIPATPKLPLTLSMNGQLHTSVFNDRYKSINKPPNPTNSFGLSDQASGSGPEQDLNIAAEAKIQNLCLDMLSMSINRHPGLQQCDDEQSAEPKLSRSFHLSNDSRGYSPRKAYGSTNLNVDHQVVEEKSNGSSVPVISNEYSENPVGSADWNNNVSYMFPNIEKMKHVGRFEDEQTKVDSNVAVDTGESSIISNILSMDFDSWDESLTSPQNLAKLLGETDRQQGSLRATSSWKVQNSNQSRFSFAREEECVNEVSNSGPSLSNIGQDLENFPFSHDFVDRRDSSFDNLGFHNGFSPVCAEEPDIFTGSHSYISSNKLSVPRAQTTAPPGFAILSRPPPPGFTSHERMEQTFDTHSGNHLLDRPFLFREPYQAQPAVNIGSTEDIEFMDPAILAVGKGRLVGGFSSMGFDTRTNFPPQLNTYENEAKLQQLMQRSHSQHHNQRYTELPDCFIPRNDASYRIPSRIMEQMLAHNLSPLSQLNPPQSRNGPVSNGHWDGWNEVQRGNDLGMAELLRNERLGYNKYYTSYEDSKFQTPSSGDLYNRTFGI